MTFSSSPVQYPPTSSPAPIPVPILKPKRRLFQTLNPLQPQSKKPKLWTEEPSEPSLDLSEIVRDPIQDQTSVRRTAEQTSLTEPFTADRAQIGCTELRGSDAQNKEQNTLSSIQTNLGRGLTRKTVALQTCSGTVLRLGTRKRQPIQTYEQVIADRSVATAGKAKRAYYGVEIHALIDEARVQQELETAAKEAKMQQDLDIQPSVEYPQASRRDHPEKRNKHLMWTEKYRAKNFTELVGDERTHRSVLKWLKAWDDIVFPGSRKDRPKKIFEDKDAGGEQQHRKIMLLTGPPGLGKTTLAHVCAKQAGYEVLEINASDDRSRDVVRGRIKDALGTETVRGRQEAGKSRKVGRPVCVVVDEVDGVVTGSAGGGGEGGFIRALIDLVQLDQRNSHQYTTPITTKSGRKKGEAFKLLRPLILICNDVYAPSLRPLRTSSVAEIVHVRKPPIEKVITRLKLVFEREKIPCDTDAVRRLCEDSWGLGARKQGSNGGRGSADGDIRGVLVQGEWMAHKLRSQKSGAKLTRKWVEEQLGHTASRGPQGLGRGGVREVVERVFIEGAGLPNLPTVLSAEDARLVKESRSISLGVADLRKRSAINALRGMMDMCGDHDRVVTDCFASYAMRVFQDDTFLSKPNASYDWLHFHDSLSSRIFSGQEWELNSYLSTSACAFHDLFSSTDKGASVWNNENEKAESEEATHPFSGTKADFAAHEAEKSNQTTLLEIQGNFSAELLRLYSSTDAIAAELIPNISRMLSPNVKPVVVGGNGGLAAVASVRKENEKNCVRSSVRVMSALGVGFERVKIESEGYGSLASGGFALRMAP